MYECLTIYQISVYFNQLQIDVRILMPYKQTAARYVADAVTLQSRFRTPEPQHRACVCTSCSFSEYCWRLQVFPRKSARKFTSRRNTILQRLARDKCSEHEYRTDVAACLREKLCARKFAVYGKSGYTTYYNTRDASNKSLFTTVRNSIEISIDCSCMVPSYYENACVL